MTVNKTDVTTQSVSTQSFLDEDIFKSYIFRSLGNVVLPLFAYNIDSICVLDRIPPYSLSVLANVLSLSLLHLVPPFPSGVLATSLTSMAASCLFVAVIAVTTGPTLEHLLSVSAVVVLALTVRAAWRQRQGTTLTLGTAFDVLALVLEELSSVEAVSVSGVAASLVAIKEKLCSQLLCISDPNNRATGVMELRRRYDGRRLIVCVFLCFLLVSLLALIVLYPLLTLLGAVALVALVSTRRDRESPTVASARIDEDRASLAAVEGRDVVEKILSADPGTGSHGDIDEIFREPGRSDLRVADVTELSVVKTNCGLVEAEKRLSIELCANMRDHVRRLPVDLTLKLRAIKDGIVAEMRSKPRDSGMEMLRGCGFNAGHSKMAQRGVDIALVQCSRGMEAERLDVSEGLRERDYSVNAVIEMGLSLAEQESEPICDVYSVFERGLRATVTARCSALLPRDWTGHRDEVEHRIYAKCLREVYDNQCLDRMFMNMDYLWLPDSSIAVDALCSEWLEDPRASAALSAVVRDLPSSGALSMQALCDLPNHHMTRWRHANNMSCDHCTALRDLQHRFMACDETRSIEESLGRVRAACLRVIDCRSPMSSLIKVTSPVSSPRDRLIYGIVLNACLHRVRYHLLCRVENTSPGRSSVHELSPTLLDSSALNDTST